MAWKQLLPGAIEPVAGQRYVFQNYLGLKWSGLFRSLKPVEEQPAWFAIELQAEDSDLSEIRKVMLPLWFEEVEVMIDG